MDKITVHLLGNPHVEKNGVHVHFPYKKAEGFFYYLCVEKNTTREEIISVLWGDDEESSGRKSLREAIYQIKKIFGKEILVTKGNSGIGINPEQAPEIDWDGITEDNILDFEDKGFMSHFLVKKSYEFECWLGKMQDNYNQMYIDTAQSMLEKAQKEKDEPGIEKYGSILLRKSPYNEDLYCELMNIYAKNGSYNMAIKIYNDLCKVLAEELGVEPSEKARELFQQIFKLKENTAADQTVREAFFYGRNKELYEINGELSHFFCGSDAQSLCFCGEPGVGKSTLMKRVQNLVKDYQQIVLSAKCYREENYFFLNAWQDIFQEIIQYEENGALRKVDIKEEKEALTKIFSGSYLLDNAEENSHITYQIVERTFIKMMQKLCRDQKVVLFIDDIHWMDATSIQLLNRLLLTCGRKNILLITSLRSNYENAVMEALEAIVMKDWLKTFYLEAFSEEETEMIIARFCPALAHETTKKECIYQMTCGNPFFLMELIWIIREKGYTLEMSQKTINVIKYRLGSLSEDDNNVLNCLAIFPDRADIEELSLLLSMDRLELVTRLEHLKEQQLVREGLIGWEIYYLFNHKMFHEYVYDRQSMARKVLCHQAIAEYYEKKYLASQKIEELLILIYHYERCHNQQKTYAYKVRYLKQFYLFFHENFPLLNTDMTGKQLSWEGPFSKEEIEKLAQEVTDWEDASPEGMRVKMEMHYITGRLKIATGEYPAGLFNIKKCITLGEALGNKEMVINGYKQLIFYGNQVLNLTVMKENVEKGLALLSKEAESDEYGAFIRLKGLWCLQQGNIEEAEALMWQAIEIFERRGHASRRHSVNISGCYNYLGNIRRCQGNQQAAMEFYKKAIENNTHKLVANGINQSYANLGRLYYELKDFEKARTYLEQAIEIFKNHEYYWGRDRAEAYMALVELDSGNPEKALVHYQRGQPISNKISNPRVIQLYEKIAKKLELVP